MPFFNYLTGVILLFMTFGAIAVGQSVAFQKVNSGTKGNIQTIIEDNQHRVYYLTDKIFRIEADSWKKLDFPVEGKIHTFYPLSAEDIWFAVIPFTSTCILYHYHNGICENIRPPLANYITAMYFISENKALFASITDMAAYENGFFTMLPPSPERNKIVKIYGSDLSTFWILTDRGELFLYEFGIYQKVLDQKQVIDFCFTDMHNGYLLSLGELYQVTGSVTTLVLKHAGLRNIQKICLLSNGNILMAGLKGSMMLFSNGHLSDLGAQCTENLIGITASGPEDIWVCGNNGRLLYHGKKQFPAYHEENRGFSPHKLSSVGLSSDDEYGVAMADFNDDEKTDIYTVRIYEQNRLYINNVKSADMVIDSEGFTEESLKRNADGAIASGMSQPKNEMKLGISVADVDNDNDQDIYLCYLNASNRLLINRGNGYFRNVSEQQGRACENMKRSNAAAFADADNDGDLDLFVTNEEGSNKMFENNGTGHFTDITTASGLGSAGGGMCASFSDVNNDGYADLCVSFWYPSNKLYINDSKKGRICFRDITHLTDLASAVPSKSNAVAFADVNNDGFTDLFIANRNNGNKLYLNTGAGLFIDKTKDYFKPESNLSNGAVFADFDLDGYLDLYVTHVGENVLYKNMNGLCFTDVTASFGAELSGYCTGCATGDVDNDGDPDLYVANYINGNSNLFLNITEKKTFVKFKLHGNRSNSDAIGTKVWLYKVTGNNPMTLAGYRELNGGSGYGSISEKELIFGVEQGATYCARVKFPSTDDTLKYDRITAGKTLEINELKGFSAIYTDNSQRVIRFFTNQENQPEIIKYFVMIFLLVLYNLKLRRTIYNIAITRWLITGLIFLVFVLLNQIFLFQGFTITFFIAPVIALGLLIMEHLFVDRILLRRLAQKERLDLREKLSRDLHDDLASTLGSISIYAETFKAMKEPSPSDFKKLTVKIASLTQTALQSISDIIWMTSPLNDSLQSLVSKTSNYMLEILTDNKINFISRIDIPDDPIILEEKMRNDAFLILKEGLHNIIRHAGAANVTFSAGLNDGRCTIRLKDDGVGIDGPAKVKKGPHGNGLVNMRRRAEESKIDFTIRSGENTGTEIVMDFKI